MKKNRNAELAFKLGYRSTTEGIVSPSGRLLKHNTHGRAKYPSIGFRPPVSIAGKRCMLDLDVHQLVAYEKFGDMVFDPMLEVRHLDGNILNFSRDNIDLGTRSQNYYDKPLETRRRFWESGVSARKTLLVR